MLNRSRRLTPPKGEEAVQRELELIMTSTRAAAIDFEQLAILDQYDSRTVETIVNRAYRTMRDVRQLQRNLDKSLLHENITRRGTKR